MTLVMQRGGLHHGKILVPPTSGTLIVHHGMTQTQYTYIQSTELPSDQSAVIRGLLHRSGGG